MSDPQNDWHASHATPLPSGPEPWMKGIWMAEIQREYNWLNSARLYGLGRAVKKTGWQRLRVHVEFWWLEGWWRLREAWHVLRTGDHGDDD